MSEIDDLEPQQYGRLYWDEDVPIQDVRKNVLRKFIYVAAGLCLLLFFAGLFVKFPDEIELPFVIKSDQSEGIYRYPYPVFIIEKYVSPGDGVTKNVKLLKITSPEIVMLINDYREAEQNLLNFSERKVYSRGKDKEIIANKIEQNANRIEQTKKELADLNTTWEISSHRLQFEADDASKKYDQAKKLFDENFISKYDLTEFESRKIKAVEALAYAKHDYERNRLNLTASLNQYSLENSSSVNEMRKSDLDTKFDSASVNNRFQLAQFKIKNSFGDFELHENELVLKAKGNGIISFVSEGEKEVPESAILLKVMYNASAFYASIKCPPNLIGRVIKNQRSELKVYSFPSYEFGTVHGQVDNISLAPDETGNFSIKVAIKDFGQLNNLLQIGMNGSAAIILEEKTFYQYFFLNVKKTYYKATMKERE